MTINKISKLDIRKDMFSENLKIKIQEALIKMDIRKYSITHVQMSNDFKFAKISCIALESKENHDANDDIAAFRLNAAKHNIMKIVKTKILSRYTPKIEFFADRFIRKDEILQELIDSL